jgi:ABC-type ATPase involved in cell division
MKIKEVANTILAKRPKAKGVITFTSEDMTQEQIEEINYFVRHGMGMFFDEKKLKSRTEGSHITTDGWIYNFEFFYDEEK